MFKPKHSRFGGRSSKTMETHLESEDLSLPVHPKPPAKATINPRSSSNSSVGFDLEHTAIAALSFSMLGEALRGAVAENIAAGSPFL